MTTTDMIVDEAERLQARVRELEAALERIEQGASDIALSGRWRHTDSALLLELRSAVTGLETRARTALTPSEPRR